METGVYLLIFSLLLFFVLIRDSSCLLSCLQLFFGLFFHFTPFFFLFDFFSLTVSFFYSFYLTFFVSLTHIIYLYNCISSYFPSSSLFWLDSECFSGCFLSWPWYTELYFFIPLYLLQTFFYKKWFFPPIFLYLYCHPPTPIPFPGILYSSQYCIDQSIKAGPTVRRGLVINTQ